MATNSSKLVGFDRPFRVSQLGDIASVVGDDLREVHLERIMSMRASSASHVGELEWDPARGAKLDALRNASQSFALLDFAVVYAIDAVGYSLPDERVTAVDAVAVGTDIELTVTSQPATDLSDVAQVTSTTTIKSRS